MAELDCAALKGACLGFYIPAATLCFLPCGLWLDRSPSRPSPATDMSHVYPLATKEGKRASHALSVAMAAFSGQTS